MRILVTAGGTVVPIDQVRCITNSFTGRTGARIALEAHRLGHHVTLLTSHPDAVGAVGTEPRDERWRVAAYRTFDDLHRAMMNEITDNRCDVVVHSAAVSDYRSAGIYAPAPGTSFDPLTGQWTAAKAPQLIDRAAGKVKSDEPELWLRMVKAPKLVDLIRTEWHFQGILVKFKLEVGLSDAELLAVAERSRVHSDADLMVANTLEGSTTYAFIGGAAGYDRVERAELPARLLAAIAQCAERRPHG